MATKKPGSLTLLGKLVLTVFVLCVLGGALIAYVQHKKSASTQAVESIEPQPKPAAEVKTPQPQTTEQSGSAPVSKEQQANRSQLSGSEDPYANLSTKEK